ncbi:hypothetical protein [Acidiphilium sp.]|uniref:hypothetical protein n=1 Tax=Acidiphilium sp. TaxID=527 RepID=UPI0025893525|nr:hypothetical protein [Acidiphilium sp.]
MTRFLANITGMVRIEIGEIVARHEPVDLEPVVEHAVARVKEAFHTAVNISEDAAGSCCGALINEQGSGGARLLLSRWDF